MRALYILGWVRQSDSSCSSQSISFLGSCFSLLEMLEIINQSIIFYSEGFWEWRWCKKSFWLESESFSLLLFYLLIRTKERRNHTGEKKRKMVKKYFKHFPGQQNNKENFYFWSPWDLIQYFAFLMENNKITRQFFIINARQNPLYQQKDYTQTFWLVLLHILKV